MTNPKPIKIDSSDKFSSEMLKLGDLLRGSERPVVILGSGAEGIEELPLFFEFIEQSNVPIVLTWGATNILPLRYPQKLDTFGTHGGRLGNLAIEASDLLLVFGARLDTKATGWPPDNFAKHTKKIIVDVDVAELKKFSRVGLNAEALFHGSVAEFFSHFKLLGKPKNFYSWLLRCQELRGAVASLELNSRRGEGLSPYSLMKKLDELLPEQVNVFVDTGTSLPILISSMLFSPKRRLFHDFNNTAMGWSIPAAIGGHFAEPNVDSIVIVGDGSMMMGIHDLTTLGLVNGKAKIVLVDNAGHAMIRQTQDQWFESNYVASEQGNGVYPMSWKQLSKSAGFQFLEVSSEKQLTEKVSLFLKSNGATILVAKISSKWRVVPQTKFGSPVFQMEPSLNVDEHSLLETLRK